MSKRKVLELQWSFQVVPSCPRNKETRLLDPNLDSSRRCHDFDPAPKEDTLPVGCVPTFPEAGGGQEYPSSQLTGEIVAHLSTHLGDVGL